MVLVLPVAPASWHWVERPALWFKTGKKATN